MRYGRLIAAVMAALLACAPVAAQTPEGGPWRMQRLYGPERTPHQPLRFWLSASDLAAAAEAEAVRPRVRMLMLNDDGGWSIILTEYRCGADQARRVEAERYDSHGDLMYADTYPDEPFTPGVIDPERIAYGIACDGEDAGRDEVASLEAGRQLEAEDRDRQQAVIAAAEAERPSVEEAPCLGNVLRNPLFGLADSGSGDGPGAPIERTFMGETQSLWAWSTTGEGPLRWPSPDSPGEGPLYLGQGRSVLQSDVRITAGRWRLVLGAARAGDEPAGLRVELEGDPAGPLEIESLGPPTLNVIEYDLPAAGGRLTFTGLGPGEARLMMACFAPME